MTARQEKVREALVRRYNPTHPAFVVAIAEVEEWEHKADDLSTRLEAMIVRAACERERAEAAEAALEQIRDLVVVGGEIDSYDGTANPVIAGICEAALAPKTDPNKAVEVPSNGQD